MATFDFTLEINYTGFETGPLTSPSATVVSSTIEDQGGSTFVLDETMEQNFGPLGSFAGTVTLNGVLFVVVSRGPNDVTLYGNPPDPNSFSAPASFELTDIDTAEFTPCFLAGTHVKTPGGEVQVETLQIGDVVLNADGHAVIVKWIGRKQVFTLFGPSERLMPVRVQAGALGQGVPHSDLTLTADHALLIDGMLINASALVNGSTIAYVPLSAFGNSYLVYHIETEHHDVILAEGAPAETYIDHMQRQAFDNYAEYVALYGENHSVTEMLLPRISAARLVPTDLKLRLNGALSA